MSNFQMSDFAIFVGCNKQRPSSIKHNQKKKNISTNLRKDRQQFCFISRITYLQIKTLDIKLKVKTPQKNPKRKKKKQKLEMIGY